MGTRVNPVRRSQSKASSGSFYAEIDYMARRSYWSDKESIYLYSGFLCYGNDVLDVCMLWWQDSLYDPQEASGALIFLWLTRHSLPWYISGFLSFWLAEGSLLLLVLLLVAGARSCLLWSSQKAWLEALSGLSLCSIQCILAWRRASTSCHRPPNIKQHQCYPNRDTFGGRQHLWGRNASASQPRNGEFWNQ